MDDVFSEQKENSAVDAEKGAGKTGSGPDSSMLAPALRPRSAGESGHGRGRNRAVRLVVRTARDRGSVGGRKEGQSESGKS